MNIELLKGSLFTGVINAFINGFINWFLVRNLIEIPLTHDLISTKADTVFSGVVSLATSLAFILTTISFLTFKTPNKPRYFPRVFFFALRNSFFGVNAKTLWVFYLDNPKKAIFAFKSPNSQYNEIQ